MPAQSDPWSAAIGAGGDLIGALIGQQAAHDAAQAQLRAGREANNLAYGQQLTSLGAQNPWYASGGNALNELNALFGYQQQAIPNLVDLAQQNHAASQAANTRLGAKAVLKLLKQGKSIAEIAGMGSLKSNSGVLKKLGKKGVSAADVATLQAGPWGQMSQPGTPSGATAQAGPTGLDVFKASPDYQFRRDEGMRDIGNSFAARGGAFSGNALRGLSDFNSNLASGEFQNFINRRMDMAGIGHQAANSAQNANNTYGYQGVNNLNNMGDARASGIATQGNLWGNAFSNIGRTVGNWWENRNQPSEFYG